MYKASKKKIERSKNLLLVKFPCVETFVSTHSTVKLEKEFFLLPLTAINYIRLSNLELEANFKKFLTIQEIGALHKSYTIFLDVFEKRNNKIFSFFDEEIFNISFKLGLVVRKYYSTVQCKIFEENQTL